MAERRGRSFKTWASIAGIIGPLALPLLFLLPKLQHGDPEGPKSEKRSSEMTGAAKPVIASNPDRLDMAFAARAGWVELFAKPIIFANLTGIASAFAP